MRSRIWARIGYTPHPGQQRIHDAIDDGARFMHVFAGTRGGKTRCVSTEILTELAMSPPPNAIQRLIQIVAPETDLTDKAFQWVWKAVVGENVLGTQPKRKSEQQRYIVMPWGARLEAKTAKEPDSLMGEGVTLVVCDEDARIPAGVFEGYIERNLMDYSGRAIRITTPLGKRNHSTQTHNAWADLSRVDPRYFTTTFTSRDNPHIKGEEIDRIEEYYRSMGLHALFQQDYLAMPQVLSGAVYPMFSTGRHVGRPEPVAGLPIQCGFDWGFQHPFAAVFCQYTSSGLVVLDELCERGKDIVDLAALVNAKLTEYEQRGCPRGLGYADPSQPANIKLFRESGIPMWAPSNGDFKGRINDVSNGIVVVTSLLSRPTETPGLVVHERCTNLITGLENYIWKDEARTTKDTVDKRDDDMVDALRYIAMVLFGGGLTRRWGFAA